MPFKDPEARRAWEKAYRAKHAELKRAHYQTPRGRAAAIAKMQRRRATRAGASRNDFTREQWLLLQETFQHRCAYCGRRAKGHLTQDHVTPLSKGGAHTLNNIVPACQSCNSSKGVKAPLKQVQPLLL